MSARFTAEYPIVFPPVRFFQKAALVNDFLLADTFPFPKREKINRYRVIGFVGCVGLVVPLRRGSKSGAISDLEVVTEGEDWRVKHWRTLANVYSAAPFFEYYADELRELLGRAGTSFVNFAAETVRWCAGKLGLTVRFQLLSELVSEITGDLALLEAAKKLSARAYLMLPDDRDIRDPSLFGRSGVSVEVPRVKPVIYHPLSDVPCPRVSILDVLVNEGPEAGEKLRQSVVQA